MSQVPALRANSEGLAEARHTELNELCAKIVNHIEAASKKKGVTRWSTKQVDSCDCSENCAIQRRYLDETLSDPLAFEYVMAALPLLLPDYATVEGAYHRHFPAIFVDW